MKKFVIIILLFTATSSCKKSDADLFVQRLYGSWELRSVSGGLAGTITTFPAGNGNIITLDRGKHYTRVYTNTMGTVTEEGTFWLSTVTYPIGGQEIRRLNFKGNNSQIYWEVSIRNDLLDLSDGYDDGYTSTYMKY